eukprot:GFUD01131478.1.p1 GENE.GFUD01131478.1~~GFUD01131478.1.p1  ORF type:complete len:420 (-),score=82.95 GFUD01131478.1:30-1289(-)
MDSGSDILNRLFQMDLDEMIQKIFLYLDPLSLKNCKCVCLHWSEFIQKRLWNSKLGQKQLQNRLINQWKHSEPVISQYDRVAVEPGNEINFLVCDNEIIVCGYTRGQARVYDISTGELKFQLQCNSQRRRRRSYNDGVQLDLGKTVIGSVTDTGTVTVWDRRDGTMLYQDKHHGAHESVFGIKVTDEYVLTGAEDGSVCILERIEGNWIIKQKLYENREMITHIDADGKWAATGTRQGVKLWDLETFKLVENVNPVQVKVMMLAFSYPHAFVVGGDDWKGIQVWDLVKCVLIRQVLEDLKTFYNIHLNGRFLTVSECNTTGYEKAMCAVVVYDVSELIDTKVETKLLWKNKFEYSIGQNSEQINAVSNSTSLVVSHASKISILNFWKDRISSSGEIVNTGEDQDQVDDSYLGARGDSKD